MAFRGDIALIERTTTDYYLHGNSKQRTTVMVCVVTNLIDGTDIAKARELAHGTTVTIKGECFWNRPKVVRVIPSRNIDAAKAAELVSEHFDSVDAALTAIASARIEAPLLTPAEVHKMFDRIHVDLHRPQIEAGTAARIRRMYDLPYRQGRPSGLYVLDECWDALRAWAREHDADARRALIEADELAKTWEVA